MASSPTSGDGADAERPIGHRIAFVGAGSIARVHARRVERISGASIVGVHSRSAGSARAFAAEFGGDSFADVAALLTESRPTLLCVCTPPLAHGEYVTAGLRAGVEVLVEKPLDRTSPRAAELVALSRRLGVTLHVAQVIRHWPGYVELRDLVRSGGLGRVRFAWSERLVARPTATTWYDDPEQSGGAGLDLQIHDIDYLTWTFGGPATVTGTALTGPTGAPDYVLTQLRYPDLLIDVRSSFLLPPGCPASAAVTVVGTDAVARLATNPTAPDAPASLTVTRDGVVEAVPLRHVDPYENQLRAALGLPHTISSVDAGDDPLAAAVAAIQICEQSVAQPAA